MHQGRASATTGNGSLSIALSCGSISAKALSYLLELNDTESVGNDQSALSDKKNSVGGQVATGLDSTASSSQISQPELRCLVHVLDKGNVDYDYMDDVETCANADGDGDTIVGINHIARQVWRKLAVSLSPSGTSADSPGGGTDLSFKQLVSLGPNVKGPNLMMLSKKMKLCIWRDIEAIAVAQVVDGENPLRDRSGLVLELDPFTKEKDMQDLFQNIWARLLRASMITGFQVTCARGPMMEEPLQGVCFFVNNVDLSASELPPDLLEQLQQCLDAHEGACLCDGFHTSSVVQTTNIMAGHLIPEVFYSTGPAYLAVVNGFINIFCFLHCLATL